MFEFLTSMNGVFIALFGAALAVIMSGIGSSKGVGLVGQSAAGLVAEYPERFGSALALEALPATQGIYGFVIGFLIIFRLGAFSGGIAPINGFQGLAYFAAGATIAFGGYFSAILQGRVSAAGIAAVSKNASAFGKAMIFSAMVETYAVLALLVSILIIFFGA